MPSYICEKCGCVDNSACGGNYWDFVGKYNCYKDEYANTHALCVECTPTEFNDGSLVDKAGKWHNKFKKKHWSEYGTKEELIAMCIKDQGSYDNAVEYFKEHGE